MRIQSMARFFISTVRAAWSRRGPARLAVGVIASLGFAVAGAAPLPVQQLTVAFTNAFPNGSVNSLTMPSNSAAIAASNPLLTGGTSQNLYTALVWVTNPVTSTLDLIYADAEQHKIWRLGGPNYQNPTVIFSWSGKGSGPPYPVGLAADPLGNVYVISPSCAWDAAALWVLPITAAGSYGAPLKIDSTFKDPATGKSINTLALVEVLVAGTAASPVGSTAAAAWNPLDVLVLVVDPSNPRVIRYSQAQIQNVLNLKGPLQGPTSTVVTQAQFSTQATTVKKITIPPVGVGMDIGQDPSTHHTTLLFPTVDGRILDFDSAQPGFITPYATNLGLGLTRLKVGTFQNTQYVFVAQLPGQILEFAAPLAGHSDTTPFAKVTKGISNPTDLAVTNSGATPVGGNTPATSCINNPAGCPILPQLSLDITGQGTGNIPPNAAIVADSCTLIDPRVTIMNGTPTYAPTTLNLANYCSNMPNVLLSTNMYGASGPTGAGLYAAKITAPTVNQYINNTLTSFIVSPTLILGNNPLCGTQYGPVVGWGPVPGVESNIPEGNTLIDITVACVSSDPPPAGSGSHPSIVTEGTVLVGLNANYVGNEFSNLQQAFNQDETQIVDPTGTVVPAIQNYITQSASYFAAGNYNCALNTLATGARYVQATDNSSPGDFIAGQPPANDQNPAGTLMARFDHLYYDVNVVAGNPPITTDALSPSTTVPPCTPPGPPLVLAATPNPIGGTFGILTLTWTVNNPTYLPPTTSCAVSTTDPDSPSWVVPATVTLDAPPNNSMTYALTDSPSSNGAFTISLNCSVNGAVVSASAPFTVVSPLTENTNLIFEEAPGQGSAPPGIIDFLSANVPVNGGCSMGDSDGLFTANGTIPVPVSGVVTNGFYYQSGQFDAQGFPHHVTWTLTCPDNPTPTPPVTVTYTVDAAATLTLSSPGTVNAGVQVTLPWTFTDFPSSATCNLSSTPSDANLPTTAGIAAGGSFSTVSTGTAGNGSVTYTPTSGAGGITYDISLACNGVTSTASFTVNGVSP